MSVNSEKITSNYQNLKLIGQGGMGQVYLAEHKVLKRKVAIKALHTELCRNEQFRARFIHEALVMAQLQHPGIVSLYEYVEDNEAVFLIIEYAEGLALDDYIAMKEGKMPEAEAAEIMMKVLEAMQYAHQKGVVHRDIKPSNIIYNPERKTIKILDFGIAKLAQEANKQLTKTGTQMGTVYYMSPEQVKGEQLDLRSDIYSLGVVFYQMLSGKNPYEHLTSEYSIYDEIVRQPIPSLIRTDLDLPHFTQVVNKATAKDKNSRYQSCKDFSNALLKGNSASKSQQLKVEKKEIKLQSDNKKSSKSTIAVLLFFLVILVGLGIYLLKDYQSGVETEVIKSIVYPSVKLGEQEWMSENLNIKQFRNGDTIFFAKNEQQLIKASNNKTPACCYYNFDESNENLGLLYNWYAINDYRNLAPEGWEIPEKENWEELDLMLFKNGATAYDLINLDKWDLSYGATKPAYSQFNASPTGGCNNKGKCGNLDVFANYWTATAFDSEKSYRFYLHKPDLNRNFPFVENYNYNLFAVRCIKASSKKPLIEKSKAEYIAYRYLSHNHYEEYEKSKELVTNDSKEIFSVLNSLYEKSNSSKSNNSFKINSLDCNLKNNSEAECTYCCDENNESEKLILIKEKQEWRVKVVKESPQENFEYREEEHNLDESSIYSDKKIKTVKIGNQIWMKENLNVDRFRNGDPIPQARTNDEWESAGKNGKAAWCYYDNDPSNGSQYGKLYNWFAVNDPRGLAPAGWHVPSDAEWTQLELALGMSPSEASQLLMRGSTANVGGQLKAKELWRSPNTGATNSSGFSGLPGGDRNDTGGQYYALGYTGFWWSATESSSTNAWYRYLHNDNGGLHRYNSPSSVGKRLGFSVRCVMN